jgi:hypothetical protein
LNPPADSLENHIIEAVFTQPGSDSDISAYLPDVRFHLQERTSADRCGMSERCQ